MGLAADRYRSTDNVLVAGEATLPNTFAQYYGFLGTRCVFVRREGAAQDRLDAKRLEEIGGHDCGGNPLGCGRLLQGHVSATPPRQGFQRGTLLSPIQEIRP